MRQTSICQPILQDCKDKVNFWLTFYVGLVDKFVRPYRTFYVNHW